MADERGLLQDRYGNGATIVSRRSGGDMLPEKTPFLASEPVRLTPAWEESNLPNDTLNLKGMTMEAATLEVDPPSDSKNLVYLTLLLHGIGALTPWNMFITAKGYFVDYKLAMAPSYANNFMPYVGLCSQVPNLLFNWINIFIEVKSNLTVRIVWSISIVVMLFVGTIILAMVDSSEWPGVFFYLTMLTVILLNAFNAIFQNSVYGMAARLPPRYVGAVVLGSNVAGCLTAVASAITTAVSPGHRTSAVYYFLTALLILLACFDTYFALPLNRYYRYHEMMSAKAAARNPRASKRPPYWRVFKDASPQLLNIFIIFFVSLSIFPALHSDVKPSDEDFFIPASIYTQVTCFLTFNIMAMIGSSTASMFSWPGPKYLFVLVWARLAFLPLFVLCRYVPLGVVRTMPILISNDWVYWAIAVVFGWSNGHFSSLAMMYIPGCVEKQYAQTAGMYGSAMLITGIVAGIAFSMLGPIVVSLSIFSST